MTWQIISSQYINEFPGAHNLSFANFFCGKLVELSTNEKTTQKKIVMSTISESKKNNSTEDKLPNQRYETEKPTFKSTAEQTKSLSKPWHVYFKVPHFESTTPIYLNFLKLATLSCEFKTIELLCSRVEKRVMPKYFSYIEDKKLTDKLRSKNRSRETDWLVKGRKIHKKSNYALEKNLELGPKKWG